MFGRSTPDDVSNSGRSLATPTLESIGVGEYLWDL